MLSHEDNEGLCHTDRDTPMGERMRRYWHPFFFSSDLPEADGVPVEQ